MENCVRPRVVAAVLISTLVLLAGSRTSGEADLRLIEAAKRQDIQAVRGLLKQGVDVNATQGDGASALHWAAYRDDVPLAELLLKAGAKVGAANDLGVTPLFLACGNASGTMVTRLLAAGASPNVSLTANGETPLMTAARAGGTSAVEALIARGADVNAAETARGQTALMWAAARGHASVVAALIKGGANVHARSKPDKKIVALHGQGEYPTGIERDEGGLTPLLFAARSGDVATAKALVAAGADVNVTTPTNTSVLVFAAHSNHGEVASFLLASGANPDAKGSGYTALHAAVLRGNLALVKVLLAGGADPNALLEQGTPTTRASGDYDLSVRWIGASPFWLAARFAETEIMTALLSAGADPRLALPDGTTPLMSAASPSESGRAQNDRRGRLRSLLQYLTDVRSGHDEREALAAVQIITSHPHDINAVNDSGETALLIATTYRHKSVVQWLAEHGAAVNVKNKRGDTPLRIAKRATRLTDEEASVDTAMVDLLVRLGAKE